MLRTALALTTAALTLAALPAVASAQDGLRVFYPGDCQTNEYKPKNITVACADAGIRVTGITWERYGTKRAAGHGVGRVNDCEPNCAAGTTRRYHAHVTLSRVRQCGDVPQFTRIRVTFPMGSPAGLRRGINDRVPCADAPTR